MSLASPPDTLAYHGARILCRHRDLSAVPCKEIAPSVLVYLAGPGSTKVQPEVDAMWFYGMNHGVALLQGVRAPYEPLSKLDRRMVESYHATALPASIRAFYYLLGICTREFRHCKNTLPVAYEVRDLISKPLATWMIQHESGGEDTIWSAFLNSPPDCTLAEFVRGLVHAYDKGAWGTNYGGKAWGRIAKCLLQFVTGAYSAEMLLDTVFTLSHNCGSIYNKPLIFKTATGDLKQLLDVQRSGQIPQMIVEGYLFSNLVTPELRDCMVALRERFPDKIGAYVDWYVVEGLGSVGKYGAAKAAQVKKHGASPMAAKMEALAAEKAVAAAAKAVEDKLKAEAEAAAVAASQLQVMPGFTVKKVQMARAA